MGVNLTDEQKAIVDHPIEKHGRVLAGPGTGKSTAAVALAQRLAGQEPPVRARFITFTRAATAELSEKLSKAGVPLAAKPSTLHSLSVSILLQNRGCAVFPSPLRIPSEAESNMLIRRHLARILGVGVRRVDKLMLEMAAKWESLRPRESAEVSPAERAQFLGTWKRHRNIFGYTLLDELPNLFRCALRDHSNLAGIDFDLIIVDEYQDLNACDLEVLKRLADRGISILCIGDHRQSIYSFRKAHPIGIKRFTDDFQPNVDHPLTECLRLPSRVFEWAQFVIGGSEDRAEGYELKLSKDAAPGLVGLLGFRGGVREAVGIAELVKWMVRDRSICPSDILILARTDRSGKFTNRVKQELTSQISVSEPSIIKEMLRERANRRLLALLHLFVDPEDSLAWWTLLDSESGLGPALLDQLYGQALAKRSTFGHELAVAAGWGFADASAQVRRPAIRLWDETSSCLKRLKEIEEESVPLWGEWIGRQIEAGILPDCTPEFRELLHGIDTVIEPDKDLGFYLSQVEPSGKDLLASRSSGVRIMSMMKAKGLTVRATVILGVDNDLIPRPGQDIEEERRLLYVAMTRATEMLFLTWAASRQGPAARSGTENLGRRQPSDFLEGGPVESVNGEDFIKALKRGQVTS